MPSAFDAHATDSAGGPRSLEGTEPIESLRAFTSRRLPSDFPLNAIDPQYWVDLEAASLSLHDWGSLQGAILVERLRTVQGQPLDTDAHLDRLRSSAQVLGITMPNYLTCQLIEQCVDYNRHYYREADLAVVILLTPGHVEDRPPGRRPTVVIHTAPLHWPQLAFWYEHGQPLITAASRNVPGQCWSPHIKTRSRLHYYLADSQAAASGLPYAGAVMLSIEGHVTESSVANLMLIRGQTIVAPPLDTVLQGLSLQRTLRLATRLGFNVQYQPITVSQAQQADALLMTGTSGCLWPASELDGVQYPNPTGQSVYLQLQQAWIEEIGLDYRQQAFTYGRSV